MHEVVIAQSFDIIVCCLPTKDKFVENFIRKGENFVE